MVQRVCIWILYQKCIFCRVQIYEFVMEDRARTVHITFWLRNWPKMFKTWSPDLIIVKKANSRTPQTNVARGVGGVLISSLQDYFWSPGSAIATWVPRVPKPIWQYYSLIYFLDSKRWKSRICCGRSLCCRACMTLWDFLSQKLPCLMFHNGDFWALRMVCEYNYNVEEKQDHLYLTEDPHKDFSKKLTALQEINKLKCLHGGLFLVYRLSTVMVTTLAKWIITKKGTNTGR